MNCVYLVRTDGSRWNRVFGVYSSLDKAVSVAMDIINNYLHEEDPQRYEMVTKDSFEKMCFDYDVIFVEERLVF